MRKLDEIMLYSAMRTAEPRPFKSLGRQRTGEIMAELGVNAKRGYALMAKWCGRGWMDYGVSIPCAWFTPEAPMELK